MLWQSFFLSLSINGNKQFIYYVLVIFLFSAQVRKVVMDTMKNVHPIYNIKVCWNCGQMLVCYRAQLKSSRTKQAAMSWLYSCPVKMFSILVLDHLTEKQSLWVCMPRLAQPGAEDMNQIQKYILAQTRPNHVTSFTFTPFTALSCLIIRPWWSNGSSPKTPTCACRAGNASCLSSATKTWPSARSLRRRLWRRSTHRSLLHSQRARYAGNCFSIHSCVAPSD